LKQRKYINVIEEQRSEITSLRSEASLTIRSHISNPAPYTNELEYLNLENRTLRNRLDRMHSTNELARSSRFQLGNSHSVFNYQPSINRNLNNNSMHPSVVLIS
jgi:hypothetical protein